MCQARITDTCTDSEPSGSVRLDSSVACSRRCDARWCVALSSFRSLSIKYFLLILAPVAEDRTSHDRAESSGSGNTE